LIFLEPHVLFALVSVFRLQLFQPPVALGVQPQLETARRRCSISRSSCSAFSFAAFSCASRSRRARRSGSRVEQLDQARAA